MGETLITKQWYVFLKGIERKSPVYLETGYTGAI